MKKSTLFGIVFNVIFVLVIVGVRYFYAKQEYDFLVKDGRIMIHKKSNRGKKFWEKFSPDF